MVLLTNITDLPVIYFHKIFYVPTKRKRKKIKYVIIQYIYFVLKLNLLLMHS